MSTMEICHCGTTAAKFWGDVDKALRERLPERLGLTALIGEYSEWASGLIHIPEHANEIRQRPYNVRIARDGMYTMTISYFRDEKTGSGTGYAYFYGGLEI